jgi:hypothetical protein
VQQKLQELQETIQSGEREILELAQQIDAFTKARDKDMSGELFQLEATLKDKEKCKAKVRLQQNAVKCHKNQVYNLPNKKQAN